MDKRFTIVLVTCYSNVDELLSLFSKLEKIELPHNTIIIDNKSIDEIRTILYKHTSEDFKIILNPKNYYCCVASGQALDQVKTEYAIYFCSNDCFFVDKGWEKDCLDYMDSNPDVGIAGDMWELSDDYWNIVSRCLPKFRNKEWYRKYKDFIFQHVQGGFYIIRMKMYKEIGGFNCQNFPHNGMDFEYSYYAQSKGWKLGHLSFVQSFDKNIKRNYYNKITKIYHPSIPNEC